MRITTFAIKSAQAPSGCLWWCALRGCWYAGCPRQRAVPTDPVPMIGRNRLFACLAIALTLQTAPAAAQLRGHGGPVRSLAIAPDGNTALSGAFDTSAILW